MDIERLNKIREICFNKSKSRGRGVGGKRSKQQPYQKVRSPFQKIPESGDHLDKENDDSFVRDTSQSKAKQVWQSLDLQNQRVKDPLKLMEKAVSELYESKQIKLQENILKFHENLVKKRKLKEQEFSNQGYKGEILYRSQSMNRNRQLSPIQGENVQKYCSPNPQNRKSHSPILSLQNTPSRQYDQNVFGFKLRRVRELLNQFLSLSQKVIQPKVLEDMRLRLNGAFDKLQAYQRSINNPLQYQPEISMQIAQIIEACLCDFELKLKTIALNDSATQQQLTQARELIGKLFQNSVLIDVEEILPKLINYVKQAKQAHSLTILSNVQKSNHSINQTTAFNALKSFYTQKSQVSKLLKVILSRQQSKSQYGGLTKSFQSWRDQLKVEPITDRVNALQNFAEFFKNTITNGESIKNIGSFFDKCKEFLLSQSEQEGILDLIFINNQQKAITYIENEDENPKDRERIVELNYNSILKSFYNQCITTKKRSHYLSDINLKQNFNDNIDQPFTSQTYSINNQLFIGLYKSKNQNKKLKFIVRFSSKAPLLDTQISKFVHKMQLLEPLIIESFKVFRKLHYQLNTYTSKLNLLCSSGENSRGQLIDKSVLNQLQYLQGKTFELSYASTVGDCFRLINTIGRELFSYEKVSILSYDSAQSGQVFRLLQSNEKNEDEQIVQQVEDQRGEKLVREFITNQIINAGTEQSNLQSNRGTTEINQYIKQDCVEENDRFELSGKSLYDIVMICLELKPQHAAVDVSTIYQLTTDMGLAGTGSGLINNHAPKYFVRLEKKLQKSKDQEQFASKFDSFLILKQFIQFTLIAINKMRIIQNQREQHTQKILEAIQSNTVLMDKNMEDEFSKISQQNDSLRKLLSLQRVIDEFLDDLKSQNEASSNGLMYFEEFHLKLLSFLHVLIPSCKRMQLFLSKDPKGSQFYTYVNQPNQASQELNQTNIKIEGNVSVHLTSQFAPSQFPAGSQSPSNRPHSQGGVHRGPKDEKSRNMQVYATRQNNQYKVPQAHSTNQPNLGNQQYFTNFQQIPSQMDDISSISPNDHTNLFMVQNVDQKSGEGTSTYTATAAGDHQNPKKRQSKEPLSRQPSGLKLQASSSSIRQNPHQQQLQLPPYANQTKKLTLKRDLSAQTELNSNPTLQVSGPQVFIQNQIGQTNSSEANNNLCSYKPEVIFPRPLQIHQNGGKSFIDRELTSYDQLFYSQLHDDSEMNMLNNNNSEIQIQDPTRVRKVLVNLKEQKCLLGLAIQNIGNNNEGIIKRNAKKDKIFNEQIDNLIYQFQDEEDQLKKKKRMLENTIIMPMVNSKMQIVGLIQLGNSEKQLNFTDHDLDIVRLIAFKIANFISEQREKHQKQSIFKKQMEASIIHTNLENQSITKILSLANSLFQSEKKKPLQAVGYFVKKTEKYLRQTFNCQFSQLLLVDHDRNSILSFDVKDGISRLLRRGDILNDFSITNALIKGSFNDPIVWPGLDENSLLATDGVQDSKQPQSHLSFYQQFINPNIDCSLQYDLQEMPSTYLSISIRDFSDQTKILGVVQLLMRHSNIRFTQSDVNHLSILTQHLSQVLSHIFNKGLLSLLSDEQSQKLVNLFKIMQSKHKQHMRDFFRELLQYKFGKINLLKNKILRKYMDRHMKVDQKLITKMEKLIEIREKCSLTRKQETLQKLKVKVRALHEKRQRNALKCMQIVNKYEKLLGIRVKDTVFRFWEKLRKEGVNISNQSHLHLQSTDTCLDGAQQAYNNGGVFSPTFNGGHSVLIHDNSCSMSSISNIHNNSSFLEESSVTSVLYLRAKAIYKMKKVFNKHHLQRLFDKFVIKCFHQGHHDCLFNIEGRRLIKLHQLVSKKVRETNERVLKAFMQNARIKHSQQKTLYKIASKRGLKDLSFGLKQWQQYTEKSLKQELRNDKSMVSQLADQFKDTNILQAMLNGFNQIFSQFRFNSADDCLQSSSLRLLFTNLAEQMIESMQSRLTGPAQLQICFTFKLPENYCETEDCLSLYCLFVYPDSADKFTIHSSLNGNLGETRNIKYLNEFTSVSDNELNVGQEFGSLAPSNQSIYPFITMIDASRDTILSQLSQNLTPLTYSKSMQPHDQASLRVRHATEHVTGFFIPLIDQFSANYNSISGTGSQQQVNPLFGSLEIFSRNSSLTINQSPMQKSKGLLRRHESSNGQWMLSQDEQSRLRQQASFLQMGLENLSQRLQMIHQVHTMAQLQRHTNIKHRSMSEMVREATSQVQKMMQGADHTLIVFVPPQQMQHGLFYNLQNGELYQIDIAATIFEDMLQAPEISSLTFPMSLGGSGNQKSMQTWGNRTQSSPSVRQNANDETFESVIGQHFSALKYISVPIDGVQVFIEIGWSVKRLAEIAHENEYAMDRFENKARVTVERVVVSKERDLKTFTRAVGRKLDQVYRDKVVRVLFARWKQLSYLPTVLNYGERSSGKQKHRSPIRGHLLDEPILSYNIGKESSAKRRHNSMGYEESPSFKNRFGGPIVSGRSPIRSNMKNSGTKQKQLNRYPYHKRSASQENESATKLNHRSSRSRSANSQLSGQMICGQTQIINDEANELDVEKAAKRKLVSAALLLISIQGKMNRKLQLANALGEWKSYQMSTEIAEGAFNKLLELNHKHSKVRFDAASNFLTKLARKHYGKYFMRSLLQLSIKPKRSHTRSPHNYQRHYTSDFQDPQEFNRRYQHQTSPQEVETPALAMQIDRNDTNTTQDFEEEIFALGDKQRFNDASMSKSSPDYDEYCGEQNAFREVLTSSRNHANGNGGRQSNRNGYGTVGVQSTNKKEHQMLHQYKKSDAADVESEFSLGTATGNKMINMLNKVRTESLAGVFAQALGHPGTQNIKPADDQGASPERVQKPAPIQQFNLYQNMFKRLM